jgi:hypothetical protein
MQLEESLKVLTNNRGKAEVTGLPGGHRISKIGLAMYCKKDFK